MIVARRRRQTDPLGLASHRVDAVGQPLARCFFLFVPLPSQRLRPFSVHLRRSPCTRLHRHSGPRPTYARPLSSALSRLPYCDICCPTFVVCPILLMLDAPSCRLLSTPSFFLLFSSFLGSFACLADVHSRYPILPISSKLATSTNGERCICILPLPPPIIDAKM